MGSGPESGGGILGKARLSDKIKGVLPDGIDSVGPLRKVASTRDQGLECVSLLIAQKAGIARGASLDAYGEERCGHDLALLSVVKLVWCSQGDMKSLDRRIFMSPIQNVLDAISLLSLDQQRSVQQVVCGGRHAIAYTPYGADVASNGALSLLGFSGYLRTQWHGCYLLGNGRRVYDPRLMRFISADRLSPFGEGGINAYAYCSGDPVNLRDDSGLRPTRNQLRPLRPEALLENPLQDFSDWQNYPGLSEKARRHIDKLPSRIKKAKKFGGQVEKNPEAHSSIDTSNSWQRYESNRIKIDKTFDKLEAARFQHAAENGLPLPSWGTAGGSDSAEPPYRASSETSDLPPDYNYLPSYDDAMDNIRAGS